MDFFVNFGTILHQKLTFSHHFSPIYDQFTQNFGNFWKFLGKNIQTRNNELGHNISTFEEYIPLQRHLQHKG